MSLFHLQCRQAVVKGLGHGAVRGDQDVAPIAHVTSSVGNITVFHLLGVEMT